MKLSNTVCKQKININKIKMVHSEVWKFKTFPIFFWFLWKSWLGFHFYHFLDLLNSQLSQWYFKNSFLINILLTVFKNLWVAISISRWQGSYYFPEGKFSELSALKGLLGDHWFYVAKSNLTKNWQGNRPYFCVASYSVILKVGN